MKKSKQILTCIMVAVLMSSFAWLYYWPFTSKNKNQTDHSPVLIIPIQPGAKKLHADSLSATELFFTNTVPDKSTPQTVGYCKPCGSPKTEPDMTQPATWFFNAHQEADSVHFKLTGRKAPYVLPASSDQGTVLPNSWSNSGSFILLWGETVRQVSGHVQLKDGHYTMTLDPAFSDEKKDVEQNPTQDTLTQLSWPTPRASLLLKHLQETLTVSSRALQEPVFVNSFSPPFRIRSASPTVITASSRVDQLHEGEFDEIRLQRDATGKVLTWERLVALRQEPLIAYRCVVWFDALTEGQ